MTLDERTQQMFFDRGPDSFLGEVIQIVRVEKLHIDISEYGWIESGATDATLPNLDKVHVEFSGVRPATNADPFDYHFHATAIGRSYGECLRNIREQIRTQLGQ